MLDRTTHLFITGWSTHAAQGGDNAHCYKSLISVTILCPKNSRLIAAPIGLAVNPHAGSVTSFYFPVIYSFIKNINSHI